MITVGSDCSGVGALLQALNRIDNNYREIFSSDFDFYARLTYLYNYGTEKDCELALTKEHKYYADNVKRISLKDGIITSEDMEILDEANQFSKKFSFYYPFSMYQRDIPDNPLDVYMSSVPCQSFSLAGNRKGEEDKRGVLFYNSHKFIKTNKPRFFIFENVKGLLSDDSGKTFGRWVDYLGGKSINGIPNLFPHEESVPYHIYYQVLNAKHYGIPQNRERIFIVGIRDDKDNRFQFPTEIPLTKRLKDVLEDSVDEKYYLSDAAIKGFINHAERHAEKGNGFKFSPTDGEGIAVTLTTHEGSRGYNNFLKVENIGNTNPSGNGMNGNVFSENGISPTLTTNKGEGIKVQIQSATASGYEVATEGDSINLEHPNSETRRDRVGKQVGQTLTTSFNQGVAIAAIRGRNNSENKIEQTLEVNKSGLCNSLTTVQKDNVVVESKIIGYTRDSKGKVVRRHLKDEAGTIHTSSGGGGNTDQFVAELIKVGSLYESDADAGRVYSTDGISCTLKAQGGGGGGAKTGLYEVENYRIRKLTPIECFRLMDFPDSLVENARKVNMSDSQLYKQAGNSIAVGVLERILKPIVNILNEKN